MNVSHFEIVFRLRIDWNIKEWTNLLMYVKCAFAVGSDTFKHSNTPICNISMENSYFFFCSVWALSIFYWFHSIWAMGAILLGNPIIDRISFEFYAHRLFHVPYVIHYIAYGTYSHLYHAFISTVCFGVIEWKFILKLQPNSLSTNLKC